MAQANPSFSSEERTGHDPQAWEKTKLTDTERAVLRRGGNQRWKFMAGGLLILGAVAYLLISGTLTSARFFVTVDDLLSDRSRIGETVRISGAVLGDTIFDEMITNERGGEVQEIRFTIAHIPETFDDLAEALFVAVNDADATRLPVVYQGTMPDLLQHEAQAILTGQLGEDGVFYATELLLKCPSRFEGEAGNFNEGEAPMDANHSGA